jgi:hypothetical protein
MMEFKKLNELQRLLLKWRDKPGYKNYKLNLRLSRAPAFQLDHPYKAITSFRHSGNSGDIIYALPSVFALSKNGKANIYLHANQPAAAYPAYHPLGNVMLNNKTVAMLQPLLLHQPGIDTCELYEQQAIDYNLDNFRSYPLEQSRLNICRWYFYILGIAADLSRPWLIAPKDNTYADHIVIARSHRYRAPNIDYSFLEKYSKKIFIGVPEEFEDIRQYIPSIEYVKVNDFLEMATIINSCRLFIGNQSFPFSVAEGLKATRLLEVFHQSPNVHVEGKGGHDFYFQEPFEKMVEQIYTHGPLV